MAQRSARRGQAKRGSNPNDESLGLASIGVEEFARALGPLSAGQDMRFALFIGAGCSVSSGIPSASTLVEENWLPRLRDQVAPERLDLAQWASEVFPGYDPDRGSAVYGAVINRLFPTPR